MEEKKKFPSLPTNYVTLQQLQERRLREQEQKQKEKEEEEERRRKLIEEQILKEEQEIERQKEEEKRKLYQTQKAQAIEAKTSGQSNRRNARNFSERKRWIGKEIGSEMQKGGGGVVVTGIAADRGISDEGQKPEESKQKKRGGWKNKKKTMSRKMESESNARVLEQSQAENEHEGNQIPIVPSEENKRVRKNKKKMETQIKEEEASSRVVEEETGNGLVDRNTVDGAKKPVRVRRNRGGIRQGSKGTGDEKAAGASGVKKDPVDVTVSLVEIAQELRDLAVADNHEQKEEENHEGSLTLRARSGSHYQGSKFRRGRSLVDGRKGRDGGLMWVKKGEISDSNGIQEAKANGSRIHGRRPASAQAFRVPLEMIQHDTVRERRKANADSSMSNPWHLASELVGHRLLRHDQGKNGGAEEKLAKSVG